MNKKVKIEIAAGIILVIAIIIGGAVWMGNKKISQPVLPSPIAPTQPAEPVMCTMEAKMCPDGKTYVSRSGPNCEFAACPEIVKESIPSLTFNIYGDVAKRLSNPAHILVTDPEGKITGYDVTSKKIITQIEDSAYEEDGGIANNENQSAPAQPNFYNLFIPNPINGTYKITVIGTANGDYILEARISDKLNNYTVVEAKEIAKPGSKQAYTLDFSAVDSSKATFHKN